MIPWAAEPTTQTALGISIGSAIFAQMTAGCPYTLQWDISFLKKLPLPMGDLDPNPHLTHGSLGPPESSTQTASQSVQPFLQGSLQKRLN